MPLARFSKAILRLRLSSITSHDLLLLWPTTSFAEAEESVGCCWGTAELLPWLLETQVRTSRFAHSPASHSLFPDFPTIVFCLPQSDSALLMCRRAGRCCCLCLLRASRRTSRRPQGSLALTNFPPLQYPLQLGRNVPNNLPLHLSPFFQFGSNRLSAVPGALPSLLVTIHHLERPTDLVSMVLFCICPILTTQPPGNSCRLS